MTQRLLLDGIEEVSFPSGLHACSNQIPHPMILLQSCLREHFQKLTPGAHINRLRHHLAAAIVDETFRNPFHDELFVHLTPGIEQNGITDLSFGYEWRDLGS